MYDVFYKPSIIKCLPKYRVYLSALVQDNPFIEKDYINALNSTTDKVKKERLLKGNWDYDDNPNALCTRDAILEIFGNRISRRDGEKYLTADIARFGSDRARIAVWEGYTIIAIRCFDISKTTDIQACINHFRALYKIPKYRCIADEDGVGGGVVDNCDIKGFVNNSRPFDDENYQNLQSQCGYKLAEHINNGDVGIDVDLSKEERDEITIELEQLQTWNADSDGKLKLKPKEQIKMDIGHSPDWRDLLLMRCYFDYDTSKPINKSNIRAKIY
jgi:hypothetical protein